MNDVIVNIDDSALLEVIVGMIRETGHAPTLEAIRQRVGWGSRSTAHRRVDRLKAQGKLTGSGRSLRVAEPATIDDRIRDLEAQAQVAEEGWGRRHPARSGSHLDAYGQGWRDGFRAALPAR